MDSIAVVRSSGDPRSGTYSRNWALGYLRGSASGYRRGTVPLRRVTSSVTLALRSGVTREEAHRILVQHDLAWDPAGQSVADVSEDYDL